MLCNLSVNNREKSMSYMQTLFNDQAKAKAFSLLIMVVMLFIYAYSCSAT